MVGTGWGVMTVDSGVCMIANRGGIVDFVDAKRIVVKVNADEVAAGAAR